MDSEEVPLPFHKGTTYKNAKIPTGFSNYHEFTKSKETMDSNETLSHYGLSSYEIQIHNDHKKGMEYLESVHRNLERNALNKILLQIQEKIDKASEKPKENVTSITHPIDNLKDLDDDLFGHLDVDDLPPANKRQKYLRRKHRQLARPIEPIVTEYKTKNETPHAFNDFIKSSNSSTSKPIKRPNSKWDIQELTKSQSESSKTSSQSIRTQRSNLIGCSRKTLYTIKDKKIVRLENKNDENEYDLVEIKLPENDAEKKLLEGTKLGLDDIRTISKFENYDPGIPTKVLFLKNLSNNTKEIHLEKLFNGDGRCLDVRLMTGRMRGQAFLTFESAEIATAKLTENNGTILNGKPIIVQYGNRV